MPHFAPERGHVFTHRADVTLEHGDVFTHRADVALDRIEFAVERADAPPHDAGHEQHRAQRHRLHHEHHAERFSVQRTIDGVLSHPAITEPRPKRLTEAQSLRWLALSEQLRGMYRTLEHVTDELERVTALANATGPHEGSSTTPEAATPEAVTPGEATTTGTGLVHVFVATTDDELATGRLAGRGTLTPGARIPILNG